MGDVLETPRAKQTLQARAQQLEVGSSSKSDWIKGAGRSSRLAISISPTWPSFNELCHFNASARAMEDDVLLQLSNGILEEELQVIAVHSNVTSTVQPGS
jgi:hypothetical protein